jgi:inosine/xanthosine triphosphate pyrophosphatase family protein
MQPTILFATTNGSKIRLFKLAWQALGLREKFNLVTLKDLPKIELGHIAEDSGTFGGDALLKARAYAEAYNLPTISQDRGFVFEALNWPGTLSKEVMFGDEKVIHTKQLWEEQREENYNRAVSVLTNLDGLENRRIQIIQGLAISLPNGNFQTEEKISYGTASQQVINGVGGSYDWFFIHDGLEITNSQFPSEEALDEYAARNYYPITPKILEFLNEIK